jgi:site-specific recombinase XerC
VSKTKSTAPDSLQGLLPDWRISLRARGRSLATIASYLTVGESFTDYLSAHGMPDGAGTIAREHVGQYLADMRDCGFAPATMAEHYRSLQQLFKWLTDDGEIPRSPMERMSPPSVPEQPVPVLDDVTLPALLVACKGNSLGRDQLVLRGARPARIPARRESRCPRSSASPTCSRRRVASSCSRPTRSPRS